MRSILNIYSNKTTDISPDMYGIFFEDINYSADGGLYCEMLENCSFEFVKALGDKNNYYQEQAYDYAWSAINGDLKICGTARAYTGAVVSADDEKWDGTGLNENNPHYAQFTADKADGMIINSAYSGISLKKGGEYVISFYAKSQMYDGGIVVSVIKDDDVILRSCVTDKISDKWTKYSVTVRSDADCTGAKFAVSLDACGSVCFDMFSMKPTDAVAGIFRKDMYDMIAGLAPKFVRFPGGCIVEGNTLDNRYKWKNTLGDISARKNQWSRWATHDVRFPYYNQSFGIGYYEYFILCERLGAEPMPIVNVGVACQYQSDEKVDINSDEFTEYINDTLDLVEFANSTDFENSKWASMRKEMGHEKPFDLKYIGIGNEQWEGETFADGTYVDYFARFEKFEKEIHARYPKMKLIACAGETNSGEHYDKAWKFFSDKGADFACLVDEHYYTSTEWMINNTDFYDKYDRKSGVCVFAGEYAAGGNTWIDALAEAAYMIGMERNSDVVRCASYAPLFARDGYTQWTRANLIMFNETVVAGTPNYYVQSMFASNRGDHNVDYELTGDDNIFCSVSHDSSSDETIIKLVNVTDKPADIEIKSNTKNGIGKLIYMTHDDVNAKNSTSAPKKIYPSEKTIDVSDKFVYSVPAYSVNIIRM